MKKTPDIITTELVIDGLKNRYRFLHVTDLHLVHCGADETEQHREYAAGRKGVFRHDDEYPDDRAADFIRYINEHADGISGVLMTGDMLDFPSDANIRALEKMFDGMPVPWVYVLGNHDWSWGIPGEYHTPESRSEAIPKFGKFCGGNPAVHKKKIGEICFVGVDNTEDTYAPGVTEAAAELMKGEENVIVLQHAPLWSETLADDTTARWGTDLCLGGKGIAGDGNADRFRSMITAENSPVKAVVCGHLHFGHEDMIDGKIPQIITSLGSFGIAGMIEIHG